MENKIKITNNFKTVCEVMAKFKEKGMDIGRIGLLENRYNRIVIKENKTEADYDQMYKLEEDILSINLNMADVLMDFTFIEWLYDKVVVNKEEFPIDQLSQENVTEMITNFFLLTTGKSQ